MPWMPLLLHCVQDGHHSSPVVGGFSGSAPTFSITVLL